MDLATLDQVQRLLAVQDWFQALDAGRQARVLARARCVDGRSGDTLLYATDRADGWYAVLSGFVKLQIEARGEPVSAYLALTGGEWFGEGSVMNDGPRGYDVVALRPSRLVCVPRDLFHDLAATELAFNQAVLAHMNRRLSQAMAIITAERTGSLEQRVALYVSRHFWHGLRTLNLSQTELGYLANISRQSANRVLRGLADRGMLTLRRGRVVAVDQPAVDRFLAGAC